MGTLQIYYLETNLICMLFMAFVLYSYIRESKGLSESRWFIYSIVGVEIYCLSDILAAFFKNQTFAGAREVLLFSNTLYISTPLILATIWQRYSREHMSRFYESKTDYLLPERIMRAVAILLCLLSLSSPFTHFSFYLDELNGYHRAIGAYIVPVVSYLFLLLELVKAQLVARKSREPQVKTEALVMSLLPIPCIFFSIVQLMYYGITTAQVGFTMGYMIVYLNRQQNSISKDELTGINNRRQFEFESDRMYDQKGSAFVAMIDVDGLKYVNDHFGHTEGDKMLKDIASVLNTVCEKGNLPGRFKPYRYGGDEFVILSSSFSADNPGEILVKAIEEELAEMNQNRQDQFALSVSIGYATNQVSGENVHQLLLRADEKMYNIKKNKKYSRK